MKKAFSLLLLPLLSSSLSGCFIDDGKWKEEYGDPVMFMETVIKKNNPQHYGSCYFLYEHDSSNLDKDFTVAKAIKDSAPFSETRKKDDKPKRFFTYQAYWIPATSGPNYCTLSLFEDGYIVIDHKKSLGPNGYLYFNMDEAKAKSVVDLAFTLSLAETIGEASSV